MTRGKIPIWLQLTSLTLLLSIAWGQSNKSNISKTSGPAKTHYFRRNWIPSRGGPPGLHYVGAGVCITCHQYESSELTTPMGNASQLPAQAGILKRHPALAARAGRDLYRVTRQKDGKVLYSVAAGGKMASTPLLWAFGLGYAGQTYIYKRPMGGFHESRMSFYKQMRGLDNTMGYPPQPPRQLDAALGRPMARDEARSCFGCHTTGALRDGGFHPQQAAPGVTCEECHGPGSAHVAAMRAQQYRHPHIFNPAHLLPGEQVDFCGNCHRTVLMVMEMQVSGILDVRFQPYRLSLSKCFNPADERISCLACHNPHQALVKKISWYDAKCLACHVGPGQQPTALKPGRACPVAQRRCAACHMPKLALPGAHHRFSDHYIRIVKAGAPYPE